MVNRWYNNISRGSEITADVYLRRLGNFCLVTSQTPATLASMPVKEIEALLMDYVTDHKNYAGSYLHSTLKSIRSWLLANDVELRHKLKIKGVDDTPTLRNERIPSKEELRRILLSARKQSRVAVALMAFGGVRPEALGDYKGQDGLRIGDIPELKVDQPKIEFQKIPALVTVRSNLSKAGHEYFTFLGHEPSNYVIDYLNERSRQGERLNATSPLIRATFLPSEYRSEVDKIDKTLQKGFSTTKCVRTVNIGDAVRAAIRRAGFSWRPYVLRCYFDTQLLLGESKGVIVRDFRTFFMGHVGDIENRYTTNKHQLPQDLIDDMRASYQRSQRFLQTVESEMKEDDFRLMFKKELLLVSGFAEEEITKVDLATISNEKLHLMMKQRLLGVMNGNSQQVVGLTEVKGYIEQGWEYVTALPGESAVIRLPA